MIKKIEIGNRKLSIEDVNKISLGAQVALSDDPKFRAKIQSSRAFLDSMLASGSKIYGVTTGFGDSCTVDIDKDLLGQLPINITRYHRCGLGDVFNQAETRAIQAVRLASLVTGASAVTEELLESLICQMNTGVYPRIPKEGSVGASGDLTPLAYLASSLIGEGESYFNGELRPTGEIYESEGLKPYVLKPKEGLALMNGTAVMTALACLAFDKAERMAKICCRLTAMNVMAMRGNPAHYDEDLFLAKHHPGQLVAAKIVAENLSLYKPNEESLRLQDRYSLRCAPHVIGVLMDMLPTFRQMIEVEINSANDNPLVVAEKEKILHGGNFYGGHIAFVMDSMKTLVANIADLMDRQLALLVDPKFNNGLPANLSGANGRARSVNHGFKAVQIAASSWTAEALKQCMPASVFSRSTECHNQDKVSMGTIAARDCMRVLELTDQVVAANTLAACQALYLRDLSQDLLREQWGPEVENFYNIIREGSPAVEEDRALEMDLRGVMGRFNDGGLK